MLKTAFELGVKLAYGEEGLTHDQMSAAQRISGVGGGIAGAGLGGLLGHYLGGRASEAFDLDPLVAKALGTGVGALGGGALGGFVGSQIPKWKYPQQKHQKKEQPEESALGALPIAYSQEPYMGLDYGYDDQFSDIGAYGDYSDGNYGY